MSDHEPKLNVPQFRGQNILNHKSRSYTCLIIGGGIILLVIFILLFMQTGHKTVASAALDNYKVKLVYNITWDNYCLNPKLEVTNLKNHTKTEIQAHSYKGPCGHNHSSSFWMYESDFNHDGHKDFAVISVYDANNDNDRPAYTEFIYTPSAPAAMPFVQQE
jgi:hypothetical protein